MNDGTHYTITISFEHTEDEWLYVARVAAYPDIESYGRYPTEAYWLAVDAIEGLLALADETVTQSLNQEKR